MVSQWNVIQERQRVPKELSHLIESVKVLVHSGGAAVGPLTPMSILLTYEIHSLYLTEQTSHTHFEKEPVNAWSCWLHDMAILGKNFNGKQLQKHPVVIIHNCRTHGL